MPTTDIMDADLTDRSIYRNGVGVGIDHLPVRLQPR